MKNLVLKAFVCLSMIVGLFTVANQAQAEGSEDKLIIIANQEGIEASADLAATLATKEIVFEYVDPAKYDSVKDAPYITVIGGAKKGAATSDILKSSLTAEELDFVSKPGNSDFYLKDDVWADDQQVLFVAGYSDGTAVDTLKYKTNEVLTFLASMMDFELTSMDLYGY